MQNLDGPEVALGRLRGLFGQDGAAILLAFPIADQDLPIREVKILHSEAERFGEAQACAIHGMTFGPIATGRRARSSRASDRARHGPLRASGRRGDSGAVVRAQWPRSARGWRGAPYRRETATRSGPDSAWRLSCNRWQVVRMRWSLGARGDDSFTSNQYDVTGRYPIDTTLRTP